MSLPYSGRKGIIIHNLKTCEVAADFSALDDKLDVRLGFAYKEHRGLIKMYKGGNATYRTAFEKG